MKRILRSRISLGPVAPSVGLMLLERVRRLGKHPVYREKKPVGDDYETLTWVELFEKVSRVGASLVRRGLKEGEVVAIYSRNRRDMLVVELAAMSVGAVACPIFSEYPEEPLGYILKASGAKFLAVSDEAHLRTVRRTRAYKLLKAVFVMDEFRPASSRETSFDSLYFGRDPTSSGGGTSSRYRPVGRDHDLFQRRLHAVRPKDPCLLMYTSGTTGKPKGVLLCHRNILSQRGAMQKLWKLKPGGRVLAYLPWHHSFGGIFELFGALYSGACLVLDDSYGKDLRRLVENFKRVKPTMYFSVPRIHQALHSEARRSKKAEREIFHPGLRFVFTAAAALPQHVADDYAKKGIPVVEGWGLTETSPCVTVTRFNHKRRPGSVGFPIPGVSVKIADDGEILVKGPNVMIGYYRDKVRTARAFTRDGWFRTGDFGEIRSFGLVLKCRKDGMFKLSNGEMVISQVVENALAADPLIQHAVAVGGGRDYVGVLVFPNHRALGQAARRRGIRAGGAARLVKNAKIRRLMGEAVAKASLSVGEKYARPKAVVLVAEEPSLANGELTPTMKVVKSKILEDYARDIEAIFEGGRGNGKRVIRL